VSSDNIKMLMSKLIFARSFVIVDSKTSFTLLRSWGREFLEGVRV